MAFSSPIPVLLPLTHFKISNRKYLACTGDRKFIPLKSGFVALVPDAGPVPFQIPCTLQVTLSGLLDTLIRVALSPVLT